MNILPSTRWKNRMGKYTVMMIRTEKKIGEPTSRAAA